MECYCNSINKISDVFFAKVNKNNLLRQWPGSGKKSIQVSRRGSRTVKVWVTEG